jgi:DNA helicase II / ATP-dependent DNA helicase PcrA
LGEGLGFGIDLGVGLGIGLGIGIDGPRRVGHVRRVRFLADLHVHSRFSRATSPESDLEHLHLSAQHKGITVVGTGDFTHPAWFAEIEQKLLPAEDGLLRLRSDLAEEVGARVIPSCAAAVRFLLSVEISTIYRRGERTRKVHHLVCVPDLESAARLNRALGRIGNLGSDGRPILGLDSRDLLEIVLGVSPRAVLIPAHIWTPWFSALGSRSGFDSLEECYGELAEHLFAVETGLSSDPAMNHRLSALDRFCLVSSSDAHSPNKLGREANLLEGELSYDALFGALREGGRAAGSGRATAARFLGTLEFFPEEGKYHLDGHRACAVRLTPAEARRACGRCPACGRPVTLGVLHRVEELADRPEGFVPEGAPPSRHVVALARVLAEALGAGVDSLPVERARRRLLGRIGPELFVLCDAPLEEIGEVSGPLVAEAARRMRAGLVRTEGGFDGEYGRVRLLDDAERTAISGQRSLFALAEPASAGGAAQAGGPADASPPPAPPALDAADGDDPIGLEAAAVEAERPCAFPPRGETLPLFAEESAGGARHGADPLEGLTEAQRRAASHLGRPVIISAGPGCGKTRTLTCRIAWRIEDGVPPGRVLAVTFSLKAADELRTRLRALVGERQARRVRVSTLHALALSILVEERRLAGQPSVEVVGPDERRALLEEQLGGGAAAGGRPRASELERAGREVEAALRGDPASGVARLYLDALADSGRVDLDGLVGEAVRALRGSPTLLASLASSFQTICVDEYQDLDRSQVELVKLLAPAQREALDLFVIGDPDQAIYGFRGADPRFFAAFEEDFPGAARFTLEESFRSASAILEAAHEVICHAPDRAPTRTRSRIEGPPRIVLCRAPTPAAEAEVVALRIERLLGGTALHAFDSGLVDPAAERRAPDLSFSDFAILSRTTGAAEPVAAALERRGLPFVCPARWRRDHLLAPILALLEALLDPPADPPRGAPRGLRGRLASASVRDGLEALVRRACPEARREAARARVLGLASMLPPGGPGLAAWGPAVLSLARSLGEADGLDDRAQAISLLTLHASKGLEFQVVFILGCEEGLLPFDRAVAEDGGVEEERRLLYVGMTRARHLLHLTLSLRREVRGRRVASRPSRFLDDLPPHLLDEQGGEAPRPRSAGQLVLF